jgi:hypothetical protein
MKNEILELIENNIELVKLNYISNELEILEECCDEDEDIDDEIEVINNLFSNATTAEEVAEVISTRDFDEVSYDNHLLENIKHVLSF